MDRKSIEEYRQALTDSLRRGVPGKVKTATEVQMKESERELRKIMEDLIYKAHDLIKDLNLLVIRLNERSNEKEDD